MKKNVFLIVVDSLRADKIQNQNNTALIPNIEKLKKISFDFRNTISSTDGTYASLGSLFTGKNPYNHNVNWYHNHLNTTEYLKEFKKNSFELFGTFPNQTFFKNISQVFDNSDLVDGHPYLRIFEGMGERILEQLDELNPHEKPWFYYIHLMDLHTSKKLPTELENETFGKTTWDKRLHILDFWIGKMLQKIDLENTIVILTADHGEFDINLEVDFGLTNNYQKMSKSIKPLLPKFMESTGLKLFVFLREKKRERVKNKLKKQTFEHDEQKKLLSRGHAPLYDDILKIPFLIHTPENYVGSSLQQVRQIDIFPTIIELLGFNINTKMDGLSLKPILENNSMPELHAYIENTPDPSTSDEFGTFIGLRTSNHKFIKSRNDSDKNILLFDLKNDPSEQNNIATENPNLVDEMERLLSKYSEIKNPEIHEGNDETSKIKEELKKMGYI